jgi:hypothetical protein
LPNVGLVLETTAGTEPDDTVAMNFRRVKYLFFIITNIDCYCATFLMPVFTASFSNSFNILTCISEFHFPGIP